MSRISLRQAREKACAKATMNALYLMVAAIAKDATTAIVLSSPFMTLQQQQDQHALLNHPTD